MNPGVEHPVNEAQETVFDEAERIIYGDREKIYGDPSKNLFRIAELWTSYLQERFREALASALDYRYGSDLTQEELRKITKRINLDLTITQVCRMMQLLKMARDENEPKRDNVVDDIGYAGLVHRCRTKEISPVPGSQAVDPNQVWEHVLGTPSDRKVPRKRSRSRSKLSKRSKR